MRRQQKTKGREICKIHCPHRHRHRRHRHHHRHRRAVVVVHRMLQEVHTSVLQVKKEC